MINSVRLFWSKSGQLSIDPYYASRAMTCGVTYSQILGWRYTQPVATLIHATYIL